MFEDEISPEEMFNRFFGGQGFGFGEYPAILSTDYVKTHMTPKVPTCSAEAVAVALNLCSTSVAGLAFEFTSLEAAVLDEDQERPMENNRRRRHKTHCSTCSQI